MTKKLLTLLLAGCVCFSFQGCTYKAWYEGFKEGQRQDCNKIESPSERQECIERVNSRTYEEYKKTQDDSIKDRE